MVNYATLEEAWDACYKPPVREYVHPSIKPWNSSLPNTKEGIKSNGSKSMQRNDFTPGNKVIGNDTRETFENYEPQGQDEQMHTSHQAMHHDSEYKNIADALLKAYNSFGYREFIKLLPNDFVIKLFQYNLKKTDNNVNTTIVICMLSIIVLVILDHSVSRM